MNPLLSAAKSGTRLLSFVGRELVEVRRRPGALVSLVFGPFYLAAIYAFVRAKNWIRVPALVWAGMMISIVTIILFEELAGPTPTPAPGIVVGANLPWLLFPFAVVWRMRRDRPFEPE